MLHKVGGIKGGKGVIKGIKSLITIDDYRAELTAVNEKMSDTISPKKRKELYKYSIRLKREIDYYLNNFSVKQKGANYE